MKKLTDFQIRMLVKSGITILFYAIASHFNLIMMFILLDPESSVEVLEKLTFWEWLGASSSIFILVSFWVFLMYSFYFFLGDWINEWVRYRARKEREE